MMEVVSQWSLERIQFLLSHVEGFVESEESELKEGVRGFSPQSGLDSITSLVTVEPNQPELPTLVLKSLAPFFDLGVLLQRSPSSENPNWWMTDLFWRGCVFNLEMADQAKATTLVPEITPLQVHRASGDKILRALNIGFLLPSADAQAYLVRPTPTTAFLLVSNLPDVWAVDHVAQAHTLINKCFIY